jgi:signal transduction histidine kinase
MGKQSLIYKILFSMVLRISVIVVISMLIGYWHMLHVTEKQTLSHLQKYVNERTQRERQVFLLAHQNHSILKQEVEAILKSPLDASLLEKFDEKNVLFPDGTWRNRDGQFDGTKEACFFAGTKTVMDDRKKKLIEAFSLLVNRYGPAWHQQFQDTYITTPDNIMVLYWPEVPTWCKDAKSDLYMPDEEYLWVADKKHNVERKTAWTGLFFDKVGKVWMVSGETPIDVNGVHVATLGHDVTINQLVDRTIKDRLPGTYNFIFREDGRLIVHPDFIEKIQEKDGYFDINEFGTPFLKRVFEKVKSMPDKNGSIQIAEDQIYLGVGYIEELRWYFVTVMPYKTGRVAAHSTAGTIFLIGLLSLLAEIFILAWVLRRQIALPLGRMMKDTDRLAQGDYSVHMDDSSGDEIGRLAKSFNVMTNEIRGFHEDLENKIRQRTVELKQTLDELQKTHADLVQVQGRLFQSEKLASIGQLAAGVAHEINNPVGFIGNNMEVLKEYVGNYTKLLHVVEKVKTKIDDGDVLQVKATLKELRELEEEVNLDFMSKDVNKLLEHSIKGLERIRKIVLDLRTFSREENTESMESIKVEEVMDSILNIVQNELKYKAELTKEYGDTPLIRCNASRLGQVFINLLVNAAQAMEDRGKITIRTYLQDKYVCVDVSDTGKGIPEENLKKIFDPFFTTKSVGQGTGLGLSVSYEIVKKHGGEIKVYSKLNEGTRFVVMIPCVPADQLKAT